VVEVLVWCAALLAATWGIAPLTHRVFDRAWGAGHGFALFIGITVVGYVAWLTGMLGLAGYDQGSVVVVLLALGAATWWRWGREEIDRVRRRGRSIAASELTFWGVFGVALFVRAFNADIIGQEKFMDMALMNALLSTRALPAEDPWLAGMGMPYYYLGYLILGIPAKLTATDPPLAYNLAMTYVFAAGFMAASTLVATLVTRASAERTDAWIGHVFGLLGGLATMVVGNLAAMIELLAINGLAGPTPAATFGIRNLPGAGSAPGWLPPDGGWWWRASRVIPNIRPDGITEFPYFSFLLNDLHPHYTAIPLVLTVVGLAWVAWQEPGSPSPEWLGLTAVVLAVAVAYNTWDLPTLVSVIVLAAAGWAVRTREIHPRSLGPRLAPVALAPVLISPYFLAYESQRLGVGFVNERTFMVSLGILFGPALVVAAVVLVWLLGRSTEIGSTLEADAPSTTRRWVRRGLWGVIGIVALLAGQRDNTLALLVGMFGLAVAALVICAVADRDSTASSSSTAIAGLMLLACGILLGCELLYVHDSFGSRMNTVFKLHYHAWLLFGVACVAGLGLLWQTDIRWRVVAGVLAVVMIVPGLAYPLGATWTKSGGFRGQPALDGMRFMRDHKRSDYEAIRWLQHNTRGRPVVIEAVGNDYEEFARVSTFSGLPTVIGWIGHELQWRGDRHNYFRRRDDVDAVYRATSVADITNVARRYGARYLFFGTLERERYRPEAATRLSALLPTAFARGDTLVFEIPIEPGRGR
jgi:YYY domain-containing protein